MDEFEKARQRGLKKKQANDAYRAAHPEKKEDPEATLPPLPVSVPQMMEVRVSGPFERVYKVYYGGTVMASQEPQLPAMVKKALSAFGRVDDSA